MLTPYVAPPLVGAETSEYEEKSRREKIENRLAM